MTLKLKFKKQKTKLHLDENPAPRKPVASMLPIKLQGELVTMLQNALINHMQL